MFVSASIAAAEKPFFKYSDDATDHIAALLERGNNRLNLSTLNIANAYRDGHLHLAFEFHSVGVDDDHAVIFVQSNWLVKSAKLSPDLGFHGKVVSDGLVHTTHRDKDSVFVEGIKPMDFPQEFIPSFVWFQFPESSSKKGKPLVYFSLVQSRFKFLFCVFYKEARAVQNLNVFPNDSGVVNLVEGRPQVKQTLTDYHANHGGQFLSASDFEKFFSIRQIILGEDFVKTLPEIFNQPGNFSDLSIGPFNL